MRLSLTARGARFVGAGGAFTAGGVLVGHQDVTRVGLLLLLVPVLSILAGRRHGLDLAVERRTVPSRLHIDQPCVVTLRITNMEPGRSPVVTGEEQLDYALGDRPRFTLNAIRSGESRELQYVVRAHQRGVFRLGPLALAVTDPFGLASQQTTLPATGEVVVLPRIEPIDGGRVGTGALGSEGTASHVVGIFGEDDQAIREYRFGDDLRRIHWPASARTGELMVRQEDRPAQRRALVLFDTRASVHGSGASPSLEWAVTFAASVVARLERGGFGVHLLCGDSSVTGGVRVSESLDEALDHLARVGPSAESSLVALLHTAATLTAAGGIVVAAVGPASEEESSALRGLRQSGSPGLAVLLDRQVFAGGSAFAPGAAPVGTAPVGTAPVGTAQVGTDTHPAESTASDLRSHGWTVTTARAGQSVAATWNDILPGSRVTVT